MLGCKIIVCSTHAPNSKKVFEISAYFKKLCNLAKPTIKI